MAWDNELNASTEAHGPSVARGKSGGDRNGVLAFHHTQSPAFAFNWQNGGGYGHANIGLGITEEGTAPLSKSQVMAVTQVLPTLPAIGRPTNGMGVMAYSIGSHAGAADADVSNKSHASGGPTSMGIGEELANTIRAGRTQAVAVCTTGDITHALTHEGADASEDGTGRGTPIVARMVAFGEYATDGTASTIKQRDHKDATDLVIGGRPRRLTPRECEALMSWPTNWTQYGRKDDGTVYELSDTARYRLCGNGVGSVCVEWIARRLADAIAQQNGLPMQEAA